MYFVLNGTIDKLLLWVSATIVGGWGGIFFRKHVPATNCKMCIADKVLKIQGNIKDSIAILVNSGCLLICEPCIIIWIGLFLIKFHNVFH